MRFAMRINVVAVAVAVIGGVLGVYALHRRPAPENHKAVDTSKFFTTRPSQAWFEERAFPSGIIPSGAYEAAVQQATMDRAQAQLSTSAGLLSWTFVGPDNIGGRISTMQVVPGGVTIYIGAANGGVFKSTDAGGSWNPIFDEFTYYSIGSICLDPSNTNTLYVGTGEAVPAIDSYDGNGVFRTTDGGTTWQHLGLTEVKRIAKIAVDPSNPQRIFVAGSGSIFTANSDHGIYRSEDGGANWSRVLFVDSQTWGSDVIINPAHPESVFAATWGFLHAGGSGVWRSTDYGSTWTRLTDADGLPAVGEDLDRISLAFAPSRLSTIFAMIIGGNSLGFRGRGVYRSLDGGATWVRRDTGTGFTNSFGGFGWYFQALTVDPLNPDRVFAGGVNFIRSLDGGVNWGPLSNGLHADQHSIWVNPANTSRWFVGGDGGFYRTTNGGTSYIQGFNLPITQFYAITVDPSNVNKQLGGTQDNNTLSSAGTPSSWNSILGGDGFYCLVDHTNPSVVFAESQNMTGGTGPQRSTTGGGSGSFSAPSGFVSTDRYAWNAPFVMDPNDHNIMLAGSHRVYKSTNNGASYSIVSGDLAFNSATSSFSQLSTIDISPVNSQFYYTGSRNGKVYRSTNGGSTWVDKTLGLPLKAVTRVTADRFAANTVYCSMSGFNGSSEATVHVYRSTDQGDTWTNISGNLPNMPVNDILVDNLDPNRLYVGTDIGVYTTQNGGTTWYPLGQGMPFQAVHDLYLHTTGRTLFAGTHGRSMYKLDLTQMPVAVEPDGRPSKLALSRPSPNPSRGNVTFSLALDRDAKARVSVFDAQGRLVRSVHNGPLAAGRHTLAWNGEDASGRAARAGVYFVRADTPGGVQTQRIVRAQ